MNFVRVDYDSLIGTNWGPVTNTYTLTAITNSRPVTETFQRIVTTPDMLFTARDLQSGPSAPAGIFDLTRTVPPFNQTDRLNPLGGAGNGLAGPGTISPGFVMTLDKTGPIFQVSAPNFLTTIGAGNTNVPAFQWASFDGTTNAPIAYPVNTVYQNLINNVFLQIVTPGSLPNGVIGSPYSVALQAAGATPPPYAYAVVANSGSLPNGLSLTTAGGNTFVAGTPTASGIFDFTLQVTDTSVPPRTSVGNFVIEIGPRLDAAHYEFFHDESNEGRYETINLCRGFEPGAGGRRLGPVDRIHQQR